MTLAVDSGSPLVSICIGAGPEVLAVDSFPGGPASPSLLGRIHTLLESIDLLPSEIERVIGTRGPGSFTGLRSGLSTLVGLVQSLAVPGTAIPTFRPLAAQAAHPGKVLAAIDALRSEWYVQVFESSSGPSCSEPEILPADQLVESVPACIVAFDSERIAERLPASPAVHLVEAGPLAPQLLAIADEDALVWDPAFLTSPLYLRAPAVKPPPRQR